MKDYYVFNFIELKEDALINNITKDLCRLGKKLINKLISNGLSLKEASKAYLEDEVPVGAVLVVGDKVIAKAHNERQKKHDVLGHAEVKVIQKASKKLNAWILDNATLYVTLEPCLMCAGAILQARIKRVVFATKEPKFGVVESKMKIFDEKFNHKVEVTGGVLEEKSSDLLKQFFKSKRS